jgi:uncharacterized protein (DUF1015 family)
MADVKPLRTLRYDLRCVGSLAAVAAPPYDVVDDSKRAELAARSPFNVVEVDLPRANGDDPYLHAQTTFEAWLSQGVVVREREPALWAMTQDYTGPDGRAYTRHGFFCRVRVEDYGPGRIRPHERTQPGPKEDRLRLTRATRANLSPIFSLFPDDRGETWNTLAPVTEEPPYSTVPDDDGVVNRLWRIADPSRVERVRSLLADRELLIADGHHRYETARVYAHEVGGEGEHSYALMFLCSLSDPGLTIFPTHRLLSGLDDDRRSALRQTIERDFDVAEISSAALEPPPGAPISFGYLDRRDRQPLRLTLRSQAVADAAMPERSDAYRRLDTAVLEAVVLRNALGLSEADVEAKRGLDYARSTADAVDAVERGAADAAFFMGATPIDLVQAVAAAGETMPPKSTYFYPKIPTGLVFNPLE